MKIDPASSAPLYQQIATDIRGKIVDGTLAVGDRLPPHRELSRTYGVSLITINKALSGLVSEGVLNSRVGRGTSVAIRPAALPVTSPWQVPQAMNDSSPMLGFVLRDLNSPFFSTVANAAEEHAHRSGYGMLMLSSGNVAEREDAQLRRLLEVGVKGVVIVSMSRSSYQLSPSVRRLQERAFPFVMTSYTVGENVPFVGCDYDRAGELVGQHFATLGRRRWGYITDRFDSPSGDARSAGFRRVAEAHDVPVNDAFVFEYPYEGEWNDYHSGRDLAEYIARLRERPDALYVYNDLGALGLIEGLIAAGIRVPDDIAVVGFDGIPLSASSPVPLTTVRQPVEQIGALAVDAVLAQVRGEPWRLPNLVVPTLVIRKSCGAPAAMRTRDPALAKAPPPAGRLPQSLAEHGRRERERLAFGRGGNPPP